MSFLSSVISDFISYYFAILPTCLPFFIWGLFCQRNGFSELACSPPFSFVLKCTLTFVLCSRKACSRQTLFLGRCVWPCCSPCNFSKHLLLGLEADFFCKSLTLPAGGSHGAVQVSHNLPGSELLVIPLLCCRRGILVSGNTGHTSVHSSDSLRKAPAFCGEEEIRLLDLRASPSSVDTDASWCLLRLAVARTVPLSLHFCPRTSALALSCLWQPLCIL